MCSDPGQQLIRQKVEEHQLDRFIVAACTPNLHLRTYRNLAASLGLNPYKTEQANIREQCSWVHPSDRALATAKAIDIVKTTVEATRRNEALTPGEAPITRRTLILGGGVAGMQAALDIAEAGYPVVLVERQPALGGNVARLSGTYMNFDAPAGLADAMVERVSRHANIQVLLGAELTAIGGYIGNFQVRVEVQGADRGSRPRGLHLRHRRGDRRHRIPDAAARAPADVCRRRRRRHRRPDLRIDAQPERPHRWTCPAPIGRRRAQARRLGAVRRCA